MRTRRRRGANAIEFALIAGPLFLIIMGTMEYSWMLFHQTMLDSAVREGARVASRAPLDERDGLGETVANDFWSNNGMRGNLTLSWDDDEASGVQLVILQGEVSYGRLLNGLVPVPGTLRARSAARDEVLNDPPT